MFEYKDEFIVKATGQKNNLKSEGMFCNASNAAENHLKELAELVGGGADASKAKPNSPAPQIELVEHAPGLEFDLENELSKAFGASTAKADNAPEFDMSAVETAFAPNNSAPVKSDSEIDSSEIELSELISKELDRALEEEKQVTSEEAEVPVISADTDDEFQHELSRLMGDTAEAAPAAPAAAKAPPVPETTITPWTEPEIIKAPAVPASEEIELAAKSDGEFLPPQMSDFDATDPAEIFMADPEVSPLQEQSADEAAVHVDAISDSVAELADAAEQDVQTDFAAVEAVEVPTVSPDVEVKDWDNVGASFHEQEISIPEPHILPPVTAKPFSGRRAAASLVAIALFGGVGLMAWNAINGTTGQVPTIMASSDPVKVKPKDAGGKIVPNQDQSVFKSVESSVKAEPQQERLADNSEKPIIVATNNSNGKAEARLDKNGKPRESGLILQPRRVRTMVVKPDGTIISKSGSDSAAAGTKVAVGEPTLALVPDTSISSTNVTTATIAAKSVKLPPVAKPRKLTAKPTPKPAVKVKPKKAPVKVAKAQPVKKAPAKVAKPKPVEATPSVSSPYAVQISSQRTPQAAQKSYKNLSRRYASVLRGKGVDIRKAVITGKGTYYRVRIPAQSKGAANKICRQLKAKGGACIVTR